MPTCMCSLMVCGNESFRCAQNASSAFGAFLDPVADKLMVAAEHTVARTYDFYRDYKALYIAESLGESLADKFLPGNTFDTKHLLVTRSSGHESFIQSSNIILLQDQLAPMRTMFEDTAKAKAAGTLLGFPPPLPPPPRVAPCVSGLPLQVSKANQTQHSSPLILPI